ncbi:class E sortase [Streptomyces lydicus]|uniref:Class E sortase n=1 Tax=Streptomyces lydicus TaxID=47763 RepID=A0A1D7VVV5_9ACTN|nr:class E sortase [Streptomyces lydicus]
MPQETHGPQEPNGQPDEFEAAVGRLNDPLNDPLPGRTPPASGTGAPAPQASSAPGTGRRRRHAAPTPSPAPAPPPASGSQGSPWFRAQQEPVRPPEARPAAPTEPIPEPADPPVRTAPAGRPAARSSAPWLDEETMALALRQAEKRGRRSVSRETDAAVSRETESAVSRETTPPATGGRAARRKAAQEAAKRGGRRGRHGGAAATTSTAGAASEPASVPTTRLEARRAARAAKDSPSLIASRALGEVFITLGVLMLLFVTYQLWWTNVMAEEEAGGAANNLQQEWNKGGGEKKNLAVGERFGIMYIPKLDVKAPIAEGIDKHSVLDHGMVGHYDKTSGVKTAMPWDKKGNFAVAAHRNTHGEPFRYINKLTKGDKIIVETKSSYYTYEMESILPQTSPSNISVIGPVPPGSGFTGPGRYITLTTCTPEFTSTFRMIVWGKMVDERPRSKGKPAALGG